MARRSDHTREELHGLILNAAEQIVVKQGLPALTVRKIAKMIGYTPGTIYLVFKNLDDLILHLIARALDDLYVALQKAAETRKQGVATLKTLGQAYLSFALAHPHRWRLVFEYDLPDPPLPDQLESRVSRLFALVETTLAPLLPGRSAQTVRRAARALWCGVHGVCIMALTNRLGESESGPVDRLVDSLVENYVKGLRAD